ncbi:ribosome-associated heat shock protein Hsp15 [Marinobacter sp. X15-166B]|uniref:ribosome-associated heat shock protein Hsp15 n=1 Tax=Marinobacter sp. X15-166B TaxID=1897620 RepID=UPI00085C3B99|nr:ribosome-associated heat shock protein Hsp15 [Marinobacter sp. X15-166B]OEY65845.1 RNA-binding protein [Marinobacter sp. X15-166B]
MTSNTQEDPKIRLDKWLWAARFYKTRSLAKAAIEGGKVHYNNQRCKPGKVVETGARVTLRTGWQEREVIIDGISGQRRGAPEASLLYRETDDSVRRREDQAWQRKTLLASQLPPARRPSKKDRRTLQRFKEQNNI